ncbi:glycosyl hydrolases family 31-domain-containing protein [Halteromyces radiatus]|uniref:glycosyl hydrolases family 31-domain-containing protein n=1 Tax=Halteromyces radiatus TaxID=101107 RepID=UPI00221E8B54|nr:glycosyl hydrolases family 31-domain-containing protein [Halteromyces radiatus]KAI8099525.1 glycosyl hydrolases family 31-domain-containing protein [Halteromyces radiatus]
MPSKLLSYRFALGLVVFLLCGIAISAMKREDFKTCSQSGFCKRNRAYADDVLSQGNDFRSPYNVIPDSIQLHTDKTDKSHVQADIENMDTKVIFTLDVTLLQDNTARVRINEKSPLRPRYDDHARYTLQQDPTPLQPKHMDKNTDTGLVTVTLDDTRKLIISPSPFKMEFLVNDAPVITLNDRGFFNFEHLRTKDTHTPRMVTQTNSEGVLEEQEHELESTLWEETFKSWTDPKPNGPESIALDISFNGFSHVYGIPEHASSLSLKETRGGDNAYTEPYRLYNLDVFEYALDSPTSLYGAVPFMIAHRKDISAGIFWMNPSETWIDITKEKSDHKNAIHKILDFGKKSVDGDDTTTQTHWISEAGVLDLFVFFGPTTKDVLRQYTGLTGAPAMPQMFAIGYHQCRWNYINEKDVLEVDAKFDENDFPYDVIWLDIEYTDDKKYFTWDQPKFPNPIEMEKQLDHNGRQLVVIVDPHIKRAHNYRICDEAIKEKHFVQQPNGNDYEAWCWPGQSSWVDFFNPDTREWWKKQFSFDKFTGTRENVYLWNDMNEPSVFNGPEITMQKEMIHHDNWEHRVLHNLYSLLSHGATTDGVRERTDIQKRPFVLARGFYSGAQRYGPVWTGDNMANWDALTYSNPMVLTNGMGGIPFSGADIPGFFGNPSPELLVRWYQTGVFQPFFRGHAHIDTKRREPYLVDEPYRTMTRAALRQRYALLPYWYTLFYDTYKTGTPMMRPMFMEFPQDENLYTTEDQFMLGEAIMVKPITKEGATTTDVYFAGDQPWYDLESHERILHSGWKPVDAPLEKIPAYYRGGFIVPRRERVRRSSSAMKLDPFTLVIALDRKSNAQGTLYLDDGETYAFQQGSYAYTEFRYNRGTLNCISLHDDPTSSAAVSFADSMKQLRIERIQILGLKKKPVHVRLANDKNDQYQDLAFEYNDTKSSLSIRDPGASVIDCAWSIKIE